MTKHAINHLTNSHFPDPRASRLIIFDVDGTLVDSAGIILGAQYETFAHHGLVHPGREAGLGVIGLSLDLALGRLTGVDAPAPELSVTYKRLFNQMRLDTANNPQWHEPLYDGAGETVAALNATSGVTLGIATGKTRRGLDYIIDTFSWHDVFATLQTADDAPSKPDPGMVLNAMSATGHAPTATIMIGDSSFDMIMGKAAGVSTIGVSWGFQPEAALRAAGADHIVHSYDELHRLLLRQGV
jgi:phosphoglycolate phosphatase